nr:unnamed protein product [Digitaria exilis]
MFIAARRNSRIGFPIRAVTGDQSSRNVSDVKFPSDYTELLMQAKGAAESALKDGKQLLEIEFPTAGLQSVPGDGEGGNEMTGSMLLIREFCDRFVPAEKLVNSNSLTSKDYPSFFYPKLAELSKTFLPKLDTVYYIHNFKGVKGGALFRCYPGPWKVLRKTMSGNYICLHQQEEMPSLKEVALDILPSA